MDTKVQSLKPASSSVEKMGNSINKKGSLTQQSVDGYKILTDLSSNTLLLFAFVLFNDKYLLMTFIHVYNIMQASNLFMFDVFCSSSKLLKNFIGHTGAVRSIDYSTLSGDQLLCSGSNDKTIRVWNVDTNQQIRSFKGHLSYIMCVKFSPYHHYNNRRSVVCSASVDKTIRFWDIKNNRQLRIFDKDASSICCIEFSAFNGSQYLCSGPRDNTIHLFDVKTSKLLYILGGHENAVWCIDISPLQSNNNNKDNKSNNIGVIGGNGYTICSG
ncbi:Serine/Threonine protein kinase [Reticulomyxa filosa]|uniref:Serine/Threonine protein kinase n=1 Tax=Reticulomyxa filosa TaxID=46433 RepID=X6M2V0_RETFI|nr:Serine/Threonine protein kinase [Reticulomyxa filosa]|eukprot:ETO07916.1 Serine/Threonine protein kinase [Reticulomyxa filosa]